MMKDSSSLFTSIKDNESNKNHITSSDCTTTESIPTCNNNNTLSTTTTKTPKNAATTSPHFLSLSTDTNEPTPYKLGIPTLRSATHRVRYSTKKGSQANAARPKLESQNKNNKSKIYNADCYLMPLHLQKEVKLIFDTNIYDLRGAVIGLLKNTDTSLVGGWLKNPVEEEVDPHNSAIALSPLQLEHFQVPSLSLARTVAGGSCEIAQQHLSDLLGSNQHFLQIYDSLVMDYLLPQLKERIIIQQQSNEEEEEDEHRVFIFHYQRPPTLRLQPGPSQSFVKVHADNEYGHQDGELNYWLPLTDPTLTKTELWCESKPGSEDYHAVNCRYGEIHVFFGSFCRHYVPPNPTGYTRISLDFRIGIEGLGFDPSWQMLGTKDDHSRRKVTM